MLKQLPISTLSEPSFYFLTETCKGQQGLYSSASTIKDVVFSESYNQLVANFCIEWQSNKEEFIVHTSGSTGVPKPISLTREQMKSSVRATAKALDLKEGERFLVCLNADYIAGKMMLVRGMELKAEMVILPPKRNPLEDFNEKMWFDFAAFVPLQLQTILEETPEKIEILRQIKAVIVGGAAVPYSLLKKIRTTKALNRVPIYSTYGMSETVTHIALKRLNAKRKSQISENYKTLPDVKIKTDERGCLVISAPQTLYKEIITNDLAEVKSDTEFEWLGRADFVINTGGVKIFPEKIENTIERVFHELLLQRRFFVAGIPDETLGEKTVLIVEGLPFEEKFEQELLSHLKKELPTYHAPKQIFYVEAFVMTGSVKVNRKKTLDVLQSLKSQNISLTFHIKGK